MAYWYAQHVVDWCMVSRAGYDAMSADADRDHAENQGEEVDPPQLSAHALAALQEFYAEQASREQQQAQAQPRPEENWQLSQFWYDEDTAQTLAEEALCASQSGRIACVSCPTLYAKLIAIKPTECEVILLEFDKRFEFYGESYVFYDYNHPLQLPEGMAQHSFDLVVADPPFLSEECLTKTAETIRFLSKDKVLLCTGAVMEGLAQQLLGATLCQFIPKHCRNLANDFCCYANYQSGLLNVNPRDS